MKKTAIILLLFASCSAPGPITLTITHIQPGEIYARRGYMIYRADCKPPDTLKVGTRIKAMPTKTDCNCTFKRIK
jgi:hypothetical protein